MSKPLFRFIRQARQVGQALMLVTQNPLQQFMRGLK